jgi:hypothetical protein
MLRGNVNAITERQIAGIRDGATAVGRTITGAIIGIVSLFWY